MANITEASNVIAAGTGILVVIGGLWGRIEAINSKTKKALDKCNEREVLSRERRSVLLTAIEYLISALHRHDPEATEIRHSRELVEDLKARDRYDAERDSTG